MPTLFADPDAADLAACRAALRGGSRSFAAASLLLPASVREPATALYAFCRMADDAIDLATDRGDDALSALHVRLGAAYAGRPHDAAEDRAFAASARRFAIPRALPEALLEGFAWDAAGRRYETLDDLLDYAARVAGTVGAMMALLMGRRERATLARACELGIAMQLSNIARDVGEDARAGRLYLPLAWLREAGIDPEAWLAAPVFTPALGGVVARLLTVAEGFYARAEPGIAALPVPCRPGIRAAARLYAEIGREVARRGCDPVAGRAIVSRWRKLAVLAGSSIPLSRLRERVGVRVAATALSPLELGEGFKAAAFLVDAVAASHHRQPPPLTIENRIAWLVALFGRLAERDQLGRENA